MTATVPASCESAVTRVLSALRPEGRVLIPTPHTGRSGRTVWQLAGVARRSHTRPGTGGGRMEHTLIHKGTVPGAVVDALRTEGRLVPTDTPGGLGLTLRRETPPAWEDVLGLPALSLSGSCAGARTPHEAR